MAWLRAIVLEKNMAQNHGFWAQKSWIFAQNVDILTSKFSILTLAFCLSGQKMGQNLGNFD